MLLLTFGMIKTKQKKLYLYENKLHPEPDMPLRVLEEMLEASIVEAEGKAEAVLSALQKQLSIVARLYRFLQREAQAQKDDGQMEFYELTEMHHKQKRD